MNRVRSRKPCRDACGALVGTLLVAAAPSAAHPQARGAVTAEPAQHSRIVRVDESANAPQISGGNGTLYLGTYTKSIYVIDEATETVKDRIPLRTGIPRTLELSADRQRIYVRATSLEEIEVVDIGAGRSVDAFTLSSGNETVRIWGLTVAPEERYAIVLIQSYRRLPDRYEVGDRTLIRYDLERHEVMDTLQWPGDEPRERARMLFSPDGELLYFFDDDALLVLETDGFTEVDRWEYGLALDRGMGRFDFGFPDQMYDEPGFFTGLFRMVDPVQNRRMMGVARVDLANRRVEYSTLGPSEDVSFHLGPDGRKAYGLHNEPGNYQFWTFDLEQARVQSRARFQGRARMALMPSSNGQLLYIYDAGNTIDVYEAATYRHLRTVVLDTDTTTGMIVLLPGSPSPGTGRR